jgi:hypothetical protein
MATNAHQNRFARAALLVGLLLLPAAGVSRATERDCGQMLSELTATHSPEESVREAQRQLTSLGFPVSPIDGLLGPNTRGALLLFCEQAEFAVGEALLPTLRSHALLRATHPQWQETLAGEAFAAWAATQPDAPEIARVEQSGSHEKVAAVIGRFEQFLRRPTAPSRQVPGDTLYSYALTKEDFEQLRSREAFLKLTAGLQGTTYPSRIELEKAVMELLQQKPDPLGYVQLVEDHASITEAWSLTRETIDGLRVAGIPDYVVRPLEALQALRYPMDTEHPGKERLARAVGEVTGGLDARLTLYKAQLTALAPAAPFRLSETELAGFAPPEGDLLGAAVQERVLLLAQTKSDYRDQAALAAAIDQALRPMSRQIDTAALLATEAAVKATLYSIDATAVEAIDTHLKQLTVPTPMLDALTGMEGIDYPHADIFWSAVNARLAEAGYPNAGPKAEIVETEPAGAAALEQVLLGEEGITRTAALPDSGDQPAEEPARYKRLILAQARKSHPFDPKRTIEWSGNACGCVHPDLGGEVYGLYPYWLAGQPQALDFSVLTRVGFYGLSFDDQGELAHTERWSQQDPAFIDEARRHGTRVDLVIYRNNWRSWEQQSAQNKGEAFSALAMNIAAQLTQPMNGFVSRLKSHVSLGMSRAPTRGDGVTLYFDNYPTDDASAEAFRVFVQQLADLLHADDRPRAINILLRGPQLGEGIYQYPRLLPTLKVIRGDQDHWPGGYLVLLREPTTYYKKLLRIKLEANLSGPERMRALRSVTLILTHGEGQSSQVRDDIIYAYDNFGGIGFWPQPLAQGESSASAQVTADTLHTYFRWQQETGSEILRNGCRFICPNRWAFHLALDLLLLAIAATVLAYLFHCSWRAWLQDHFIHFIALIVVPFVLTGMSLLFCDPTWDDLSKGNSLLILLVAAVIAYALWNYRRHRQRATLP